MLGTLYVVISSSKEEDYQKVKEELLDLIQKCLILLSII